MTVRLMRLLKGYVEFSASGGFAERFINLCTVNNIILWNVKNDGVKVTACTTFDGYLNMRKAAENSGMKLKIIKKHGLLIFTKRHNARFGAALGVFLAFVLIVVSSGHIWSVEITGDLPVKRQDFTEKLDELGVYTGARKSKTDSKTITDELLNAYPQLSWASVNIYGTKLVVEVRKTEEPPEIEDTDTPCNLVASKTGKIVLVKGYRGTNKVKEGDVVEKGDILISGIVTNADYTEELVKASGAVTAQTVTEISSESDFNRSVSIIGDCSVKYKLFFFGLKLPLSPKGKNDCFLGAGEKYLEGGKEKLPVGIFWETKCVEKEKNIDFSEKESLLLALSQCVEKSRSLLSENDVGEITFKKKTSEQCVKVSCVAKGTENIAVSQKIYVEK